MEQSIGLMKHARVPVRVVTITAGKFRRYKDIPLHKQLLHWQTVSRNCIDVCKVVVGFVQSIWLLLRYRPQVVFAKGGYVSLPLGYAAHCLRIPLVLHDSDTRPGLTNRVLARFAAHIATGAPTKYYPAYKNTPITYVGVPIDDSYHPFTKEKQYAAKELLGIIHPEQPLVVVTGGGLGSRDINTALVAIAPRLLERGLSVYHITGTAHSVTVKSQVPHHPDYVVVPFVYADMASVLGAADVVVSRASATFLQEIAALHKPAIIIPSGSLGDQLKNAESVVADGAGIVMTDGEIGRTPDMLLNKIVEITTDSVLKTRLSKASAARAMPNAAHDTAQIVIQSAR